MKARYGVCLLLLGVAIGCGGWWLASRDISNRELKTALEESSDATQRKGDDILRRLDVSDARVIERIDERADELVRRSSALDRKLDRIDERLGRLLMAVENPPLADGK
ncbi:MAG: hypothetical protein K6F50_02430 [Kiritimatiellae bacterium]|nr:hypothetical protein [Kiritimatiellia bacterium]